MSDKMFIPANARAASAYNMVRIETDVNGATPHQLVSMLFEALLKSLSIARAALVRGDVQTKGNEISKSVRILEEGLKAGLQDVPGSDVSTNLRSVYTYCVRTLTLANLKNDAAKLDEVAELILPISQAWSEINASEGSSLKATGT